MATVICKVLSATTDNKGVTSITLELTDAQAHVWQKTYTFRQTEPINLQRFKDQIIADIRKDLNIKTVLEQITPFIGQSFNLTI